MDLLVSICNIKVPLSPRLALVDLETGEVSVPRLPAPLLRSGGMSGLHQCDRYVYIVAQKLNVGGEDSERPSALFVLDRGDLSLRSEYVFERASDVHSLRVEGDRAWAVSTGTDEVIQLELDGPRVASERVLWRPDPDGPREDRHHLNAICRYGGRLVASGFGLKAGAHWGTADEGFVYDLDGGEYLFTGIGHPHSLIPFGDRLLCCESKEWVMRDVGEGRRTKPFPGYTRGLCEHGGNLFVGVSKGRLISRSMNVANRAAPSPTVGACGVWRVSGRSWKRESAIDLSDLGQEIYDLMPVEGTEAWPRVPDSEWRPETLRHLWATLERTQHRARVAERRLNTRRAGGGDNGADAAGGDNPDDRQSPDRGLVARGLSGARERVRRRWDARLYGRR